MIPVFPDPPVVTVWVCPQVPPGGVEVVEGICMTVDSAVSIGSWAEAVEDYRAVVEACPGLVNPPIPLKAFDGAISVPPAAAARVGEKF